MADNNLDKSKQFIDRLTIFNKAKSASDFQLLSFITSRSQTILQERQNYYKELLKLRDNYIVNGIYDILQHDVFLYNIDGQCWTLDHPDPIIKFELTEMLEKLNLTETLYSIFGDLVHYGSYALRPVYVPGQGIVKLIDDLYPYNVVAITDGSPEPVAFYIDNTILNQTEAFDKLYNGTSSYYLGTNYQVVYFKLDFNYRKLIYNPPADLDSNCLFYLNRLHNEDQNIAGEGLEFTYQLLTPKSFIDGVMDKLAEALLVDKASVVKKVASIVNNSIIGVPMPNLYDIEQITDTIQQYESLLNSASVLDILNSDNPLESLAFATKLKAVPIMGDTGRGDLREMDLGRKNQEIDPTDTQGIIGSALDSLGIPQDLYFGNLDSKTNLKQNIRYAKKIKFIQTSLVKEIKNICYLHYRAKYDKELDLKPLSISLKNNINYDELENVDSQDLMISSTTSMLDLFERLESVEASNYKIDKNKLMETVKENLHSIGSKYTNVLTVNLLQGDTEETETSPDDGEDDGDMSEYQAEGPETFQKFEPPVEEETQEETQELVNQELENDIQKQDEQ